MPRIDALTAPLLLVLLWAGVSCADGGSPSEPASRTRQMPAGLWGGQGLRFEVTGQGAVVEYDCAHGTVDQPIVLDAEGRFEAAGTHAAEHGGPVREGEQPETHPARYAGKVQGSALTVTVTLTDSGETVGTFAAALGRTPVLRKCL